MGLDKGVGGCKGVCLNLRFWYDTLKGFQGCHKCFIKVLV